MWHYQHNNQQQGPVSWQQLQQLAQQGVVTQATLVRNLPNGQWVAAAQLPNLFARPAVAAAPPIKRAQALPPGKLPTAAPLPPAPKPVGMAAPVAAPAPAFSPAPSPASSSSFSISPTPAVSSRPASGTGSLEKKEEKSKLPLVIGLAVGGCIAVCLLIVALFMFNGASPEKPVASNSEEESSPIDPDNEGSAASPVAVEQPPAESPSEKPPVAEPAPPAEDTAAILEVLQKVAKFRDITKVLAGGKKPARIAVSDIWFSADGQARRPEKNTAAPQNDDVLNLKALGVDPNRPKPGTIVPAPAPAEAAPPPKYLHIAVSISNVGEEGDLKYQTWNNLQADLAERAILIDDQRHSYSLIPLTEAPRTAPPVQNLAPGAETTDVLVFAAPPAGVSKLRLILPYQNVGHEDYLGFEIPASRLPYPPTAAELNNPLPEMESEPPATELPSGIVPEAAKPETPKEETIEDLRRSIEEGE